MLYMDLQDLKDEYEKLKFQSAQVFFSVDNIYSSEFEEKKSRFLSFVIPVSSVEEAKAYLQKYRKHYADAVHVVHAYHIGGNSPQLYQHSCDDGEPASTAGKPVLEVLSTSGLTDCLVIVVRYFGGILLGAGGLIRAYRRACLDVLNKAGRCCYSYQAVLVIDLAYSDLDTFVYYCQERRIKIQEIIYTDKVCLKLSVAYENFENLYDYINNLTNGQLKIGFVSFELQGQPVV